MRFETERNQESEGREEMDVGGEGGDFVGREVEHLQVEEGAGMAWKGCQLVRPARG